MGGGFVNIEGLMAHLIEHLADLTALRDRDMLDATVVRAIKDLLHPLSVAIYRCVGEAGSQRWLTRARQNPGESAATADSLWTPLTALPTLDEIPARLDCLNRVEIVTQGDGPQQNFFPIATEREVIAVLDLVTVDCLTAEDRTMVCTVLRLFGNFHDLLDHSERDPLTGLLNRQTFDAAFMKRIHSPTKANASNGKARRVCAADSAVWLGVADIDHFKRVNDVHGHMIGDEVLLLMSRLMRSSFRYHDRLYRFGGEEFVVLLNCLAVDEAVLAFERLRCNVEGFMFPQVGRITVSIGFTRIEITDSPSAAFSRADEALYHAKATGRNIVIEYEDLVRNGLIVAKNRVGGVELF